MASESRIPSETALGRLAAYANAYRTMRALDPEAVHSIARDGQTYTLRLSDLSQLIAVAQAATEWDAMLNAEPADNLFGKALMAAWQQQRIRAEDALREAIAAISSTGEATHDR
jgi:hypothetical protein